MYTFLILNTMKNYTIDIYNLPTFFDDLVDSGDFNNISSQAI